MSKEKNENLEFAEYNSSISREIFNKNRKYDSFMDESRRVIQHGKSLRIKESDFRKVFDEGVKILLKKYDFDINQIFKGEILSLANKGKKENVKSLKIADLKKTNKKRMIVIQYMGKDKQEFRIILKAFNSLFSKSTTVLEYLEYTKSNDTLFGLKDEVRKKMFRKYVNYKASLLATAINKQMPVKDIGSYEKYLNKSKSKGYINAL